VRTGRWQTNSKIEDRDAPLEKFLAPSLASSSSSTSSPSPRPASLDRNDQTASVDRMMVAHYAIPAPPLVHGQSKVSHKLRLSQQEETKLRLTIFAFFVACLTGLFLFVNIVSPEGFPASRDEYRSRGVSGSDRIRSLSASWAYYSPYYPAAEFDGSTRKGCVVSQVNIVSSQFGFHFDRSHRRSTSIHHAMRLFVASTPWCPISNLRSGQVNRKGAREASSRLYLRRS